jgi:hypothetical protein
VPLAVAAVLARRRYGDRGVGGSGMTGPVDHGS